MSNPDEIYIEYLTFSERKITGGRIGSTNLKAAILRALLSEINKKINLVLSMPVDDNKKKDIISIYNNLYNACLCHLSTLATGEISEQTAADQALDDCINLSCNLLNEQDENKQELDKFYFLLHQARLFFSTNDLEILPSTYPLLFKLLTQYKTEIENNNLFDTDFQPKPISEEDFAS